MPRANSRSRFRRSSRAIRSLYIQIYVEHEDYVRNSGIGYSLSMIRKNETVGERPFFESLKLQPADLVTGKVVSPSGEPLSGVKLFGFTSPESARSEQHRWLDTKTAADGSFRLNTMKGGVAFFWVLPNDYSIVQKFVSNQPGDLGEIRVPEGIRMSGRTLSADGKPVAGVAINAYYQGRDEALQAYAVLSGIRRGAITDAEGRFTIDPLPPGEYRVVPEDELIDPRHERDLHPLPGVFVAQKTTLKEGSARRSSNCKPCRTSTFMPSISTARERNGQGHEFFINGRLDASSGPRGPVPTRMAPSRCGLPHGLQDVQLSTDYE